MKILKLTFLILSISIFSNSQTAELRPEDKIRIAEAQKIASLYGDSVWTNWHLIPFSTLLITPENEFLIYHPYIVQGFTNLGFDDYLKSEIYSRGKNYNINLLATFSAVDSIPSIVVGIPESTNTSSSRWVITLLHEHFHQMQYTSPGYQQEVLLLGLAGDDQTSMWMLNYPFPYEDEKISKQFTSLMHAAMLTVLSKSSKYFSMNFKEYISEREKFKDLLSEKDYRYFSFQIWQEGIARYTEYKITELVKDSYRFSREMEKLNDFTSLDSLYLRMFDQLIYQAVNFRLNEMKRTVFYTLGALEGMILDRANPQWKDNYFKEKFYLEKYYNSN